VGATLGRIGGGHEGTGGAGQVIRENDDGMM